jgi:hypothetical protein
LWCILKMIVFENCVGLGVRYLYIVGLVEPHVEYTFRRAVRNSPQIYLTHQLKQDGKVGFLNLVVGNRILRCSCVVIRSGNICPYKSLQETDSKHHWSKTEPNRIDLITVIVFWLSYSKQPFLQQKQQQQQQQIQTWNPILARWLSKAFSCEQNKNLDKIQTWQPSNSRYANIYSKHH